MMKYENTLPLSAVEVEALLEELRSGDPESTINEWQNSVMQSDESEKKPDPVNPSHYKKGKIECIDAIKSMLTDDEWRGFLKGTSVAYLWRLGHKDAVEQDAKKTLWYVSWLANKDPRG
jgi:hypothetical protein